MDGKAATASATGEAWAFGIGALLVAALCSSLAGVSFEKMLKGHAPASLWARNLQLAFWSILTGLFTLSVSPDFAKVRESGFFHGYTPLTFLCIATNGWGGLIVGMCLKYADAIVKDLAIACSICLSATASIWLFAFEPSA